MIPAKVAELDAHEGPVYVADEDALYFTSVPRPEVDIKRLSLRSGRVTVVRADANKANGMALAPDGRLLVCEQGTFTTAARISLVDRATGATQTLVDAWNGAPLSSPNDIVVKRDACTSGTRARPLTTSGPSTSPPTGLSPTAACSP